MYCCERLHFRLSRESVLVWLDCPFQSCFAKKRALFNKVSTVGQWPGLFSVQKKKKIRQWYAQGYMQVKLYTVSKWNSSIPSREGFLGLTYLFSLPLLFLFLTLLLFDICADWKHTSACTRGRRSTVNQKDAPSTLQRSVTWGSTFARTRERSPSGESALCACLFVQWFTGSK